jgi:hypothetical protein
MDPAEYYRSITLELKALKGRVRQLIADAHWVTDGEWKESVLRTLLKRHMPTTIGVGRGFIIDENATSTQIDVLIYDKTRPLLHQDGDLVFTTPDAVRGIIEVKSTIEGGANLTQVLRRLATNGRLARPANRAPFIGLFGYECALGDPQYQGLLNALQEATGGDEALIVNHVCAGESLLARYWTQDPFDGTPIAKWYSYDVAKLAPGYFLSNALESAVGGPVRENLWAWFPREGKEINRSGEIPFVKVDHV